MYQQTWQLSESMRCGEHEFMSFSAVLPIVGLGCLKIGAVWVKKSGTADDGTRSGWRDGRSLIGFGRGR